jgi:hypothetical protein
MILLPSVVDYSIIVAEDEHDLVIRVKAALKDGWVPLNGPFLTAKGYPAQALVIF